jgi:hypothetical protein
MSSWAAILAYLKRALSSVKRMEPFSKELRSELILTIIRECVRTKMRRNTHGLFPMNLSFDQDDVGIHVVIVILEASYSRATHDLSNGSNDSLVKVPCATGEGEGVGLAPK